MTAVSQSDYADVSVEQLALMLFPEEWKPRTRMSNHSYGDRLRFLVLAGLLMEYRLIEKIAVSFKPNHDHTYFVKELNDGIRQAGGSPLSYVGWYSRSGVSARYIVDMPFKETIEYDFMIRFLIRYADLKPRREGSQYLAPEFLLRRRPADGEPEQRVFMAAVTNRGFQNGIIGFSRAATFQPGTIIPTTSKDIHALGAKIAASPFNAIAGLVEKSVVRVPTQCLTKAVVSALSCGDEAQSTGGE